MFKVSKSHSNLLIDSTKITLTPNWNFAFGFFVPLNTSLYNIEIYNFYTDNKGDGNYKLNNSISLKNFNKFKNKIMLFSWTVLSNFRNEISFRISFVYSTNSMQSRSYASFRR